MTIRSALAALMVASTLPNAATSATTERPLLEAATEMVSSGETQPDARLTNFVMSKLDKSDREGLDECLAGKGLKAGGYSKLLSAVHLKPSPGVDLYFVRPAHEPYCWVLYGAHLFRYFLVEAKAQGSTPRYRMVFANGGDRLAIYPKVSHGLYDIETTGCTAGDCWSVRARFNGSNYEPVSCKHTQFTGGGKSTTRAVSCDWTEK